MPPRVIPAAQPFKTRLWKFIIERKRDFFFASVALFALGTVVRRELMMKGVVPPPQVQQQQKIMPRVERKFGSAKREE
jgi:hypothetical protein